MSDEPLSDNPAPPGAGPQHRRGILRWLVRAFLSLWGFAGAGVVFSFVKNPRTGDRGIRTVSAGPLSSLPVGEARLVRHGSRPLFVLRISETEVQALSAVCTHRQCVLEWSRERKVFVCPCHDGIFDASGNVVSGLPTRRLEQYRASVRRNEIVILL